MDEEKIRASKRLFFTATPVLYRLDDVEHFKKQRIQIASMRDPSRFGRVLYRLSFAEAIERKLLCPYQVVFMPVRTTEVETLIDDGAIVTTDGGDTSTDAYSLATQIACARAIREHGCRRMVSFHKRIKHSRAFAAQINQSTTLLPVDERPEPPLVAKHVDGKTMPRGTRTRIFNEFAQPDATPRMLTNVKLFTEGIDVPGIDAITLVDTHRSPESLVQIIGRAVRPSPGKTVGTIILPVLIRGAESVDVAMARSEHRDVIALLSALRDADPEIERSITDLRVRVGPDGEPWETRRFVIGAPTEVGPEFAEAIEIMLVDRLAVGQPRKSASERVPKKPGLPDWTKPKTMALGLGALDAEAERWLLPSIRPSDVSKGFPIGQWWSYVLTIWDVSSPSYAIKRRIAHCVSWLGVDRTEHPRVRKDLMQLTDRPLAEQFDAWVTDPYTAPRALWELYRFRVIGEGSEIDTQAVVDAVTHQGMLLERQADLIAKVLEHAGRRAWGPADRSVFARGFHDGLKEVPKPCPMDPRVNSHNVASEIANYVRGWEAAAQFADDIVNARDSQQALSGEAHSSRFDRRPKVPSRSA